MYFYTTVNSQSMLCVFIASARSLERGCPLRRRKHVCVSSDVLGVRSQGGAGWVLRGGSGTECRRRKEWGGVGGGGSSWMRNMLWVERLSQASAMQAWRRSAGRLSATVGVRAEGQGHSPRSRCQRGGERNSGLLVWTCRRMSVRPPLLALCVRTARTGGGGGEGRMRCKMHDGRVCWRSSSRFRRGFKRHKTWSAKCKRPGLDDLPQMCCAFGMFTGLFESRACCCLCWCSPKQAWSVWKTLNCNSGFR